MQGTRPRARNQLGLYRGSEQAAKGPLSQVKESIRACKKIKSFCLIQSLGLLPNEVVIDYTALAQA